MKKNLVALLPIAAIILSGCGANYYAIHKVDTVEPGKSSAISVDAKQRFLLASALKNDQSNTADPKISHRFCAEASPDVFTALGQAVSVGGSFGQSASTQEISLALKGAFSSAETSSTIARTQTINILKEMMYRTCERYLNGSIDDKEYPIVAARDQRVITSILAIEQLTSATIPKPTVIASTGNTSAEGVASDSIIRVDEAKKDAEQKNAKLKEAEGAYKAADEPQGKCGGLAARAASDLSQDEKLAKEESKRKALDLAKESSQKAATYYETLLSLARGSGTTSSVTSALFLSRNSSTDMDLKIEEERSKRIASVAKIVQHIVDNNFDQGDETSFFCYRILDAKQAGDPLHKSCVTFITAKTEKQAEIKKRETAQIKLNTVQLRSEYQEAMKKIEAETDRQFNVFWNKIKDNSKQDSADTRKLKSLVDRILQTPAGKSQQEDLEMLKKGGSKEETRKLFDGLASEIRRLLSSD